MDATASGSAATTRDVNRQQQAATPAEKTDVVVPRVAVLLLVAITLISVGVCVSRATHRV